MKIISGVVLALGLVASSSSVLAQSQSPVADANGDGVVTRDEAQHILPSVVERDPLAWAYEVSLVEFSTEGLSDGQASELRNVTERALGAINAIVPCRVDRENFGLPVWLLGVAINRSTIEALIGESSYRVRALEVDGEQLTLSLDSGANDSEPNHFQTSIAGRLTEFTLDLETTTISRETEGGIVTRVISVQAIKAREC